MAKHSTLVAKRLSTVEKALNKSRHDLPDYNKLYKKLVQRKDEATSQYLTILQTNNVNHNAYQKIQKEITGWGVCQIAARMALLESEIRSLRKDNWDLLVYNRDAMKAMEENKRLKVACTDKDKRIEALKHDAVDPQPVVKLLEELSLKLDQAITNSTKPSSIPTPQRSFVSSTSSHSDTNSQIVRPNPVAAPGNSHREPEENAASLRKVAQLEVELASRLTEEQTKTVTFEQVRQLVRDKVKFTLDTISISETVCHHLSSCIPLYCFGG